MVLLHFECWVHGDDPNSLFLVHVPTTGTITDLKDAIKTKQPTKLRDVEPNDLKLYTIPSPTNEHIEATLFHWTFDGKSHLNSRQKLVNLSNKLVLVRVPTPGMCLLWYAVIVYDKETHLCTAQFSLTVPDIMLNCWLHGEAIHKIFPVDVSRTKTLGALKQAIKAERSGIFGSIDAANLRLYHVPNCTSQDLEKIAKGIDFDQLLLGVMLLSDIFSATLVKDHIHIIVCGPSPGVSIFGSVF